MTLSKGLLSFVLAGIMGASGLAAEISVRIAPPRARVERRGPAPGRGYVWVPGYQRWDGHAYAWEPGRWDMPPRPRARWEAHHWVKRHGEWVFVEGRWR